MEELPIENEKLLNVGINLPGRINQPNVYSFFHYHEEPLTQTIENRISIKTFLENDSRAMAFGKFCCGAVNHEKTYCL